MLASQSRYKPGEPRPPAYEVHEGVHIHRVPATSLGRRGTWARMTDYLSFYAGALVKAMLLPRYDAVVTLTTPPVIGLIGTVLKRFKKTRHVYWSMDLHPDASLALGRMSPKSLLGRSMSWLSGFVYRHADQVVVLGPYMADRIALKGVPSERIATIPVWSQRDEIYPTPRDANPMRKALGLEGAFVAMYSGNLGLAHSFDEFIEAARRLRDRPNIVFLFVGGGPRLEEVKAARDREGLENIRLLDYVPRAQLQASLAMADVHLISMRPEMTGIVVPGKLYGAMAAGRPAVFVGPEHCEPADTIRDAGCGITITPWRCRRPGGRALEPRIQPESRSAHGRKRTHGVSHHPRAKTLLQSLVGADWRLARSTRNDPAATDRAGASAAHEPRCRGSVSNRLAVNQHHMIVGGI